MTKSMFIKNLLLTLSFMPMLAFSQAGGDLPFEPIHASEQQRLTSRSLQEELNQFRAISQGLTAETQYEVAQRKFAQAKLALDRAQSLLNSGATSETKFAAVYYEYRQLQADVIRLPIEIAKAKLTAEIHKWRVAEVGNPGVHHELELVAAMIKGVDSELQTLSTSLELAKVASQLAEKFWQHGQDLVKKGSLASEQFELREMAYKNAVSQVKGIEQQIELEKTARASLLMSQQRLASQAKAN